jgi:hypothetical protein
MNKEEISDFVFKIIVALYKTVKNYTKSTTLYVVNDTNTKEIINEKID